MTLKEKFSRYRDLVVARDADGAARFVAQNKDDTPFTALVDAQKRLAAAMRRSQARFGDGHNRMDVEEALGRLKEVR